MKKSVTEKFRELAWRKSRSAEEEIELQKMLQSAPELYSELQSEEWVTQQISNLKTPPVSSNFTSLVLEQISRESKKTASPAPSPLGRWLRPRWIARLSFAAVALFLGLFSLQQYRVVQRNEMARSLATVSQVAAMPPIEWLKDFDAIAQLGNMPVIDDELISLMQAQ